MENNPSTSAGIGFLGLLTIVFIVLKLLEKIMWPWWLVLAPLWAPTAVVIVIFFAALIIGMVRK